jgi:F-type H+-transporting ATPase subunit b
MKTSWKSALAAGALTTLLAGPVLAEEPHGAPQHGGEHGGGHGVEHGTGHHAPHVEFFKWDSNAPPVGWLAFDFAIFLWLLVRFAGKPLADTVASRHLAVKKAIEEAAAAKAEAEKKAAEFDARIKSLDAEVDALRAEFRKAGDATRERLAEAGKRTAERIARDAALTISAEEQRARDLLQQEAARLALDMAEKLVRERLGAGDHQKLREDFVRELGN